MFILFLPLAYFTLRSRTIEGKEGAYRKRRVATNGGHVSELTSCLQLASGVLQRNVTVNVKSVSTPTATG